MIYRITDGKFRRGPAHEEETMTQTHGRLMRITHTDGPNAHGYPSQNLEVELNADGQPIRFKTNYRTLSSSISLMKGLIDSARGELLVVETVQGTHLNRHGRFPTYVNVYAGETRAGKVVPRQQYGRQNDAYGEAHRDQLLKILKTHPAYQEPAEAEAEGARQAE